MFKPENLIIPLFILVSLIGVLVSEVVVKGCTDKEHQQLIQECQAKLPRDKFCKLIAVEDK